MNKYFSTKQLTWDQFNIDVDPDYLISILDEARESLLEGKLEATNDLLDIFTVKARILSNFRNSSGFYLVYDSIEEAINDGHNMDDLIEVE